MTGRPTKRTPPREHRLLEAIRGGATRQAACHYAGIDLHTLARWIARYATFATALTRAEADAEVRMTAIVARAAEMDWRAAAWWLERRRSEDYGKRERVELTLQRAAEQYASDMGLDVNEVLAEAEAIARRVERA